MQCEIRSMNEKERAKKESKEEPLPPEGFVQQVCQGWLVHEDSALAHKLQEEEIELHYGKNRTERRVVREDLQCARNMQEEEEEEATSVQRMYDQLLLEQEETDAEIALQLQKKEQMEMDKLHHFRAADEAFARHLQEKEKNKYEKKKREKGIQKEMKQVEKARVQCQVETEGGQNVKESSPVITQVKGFDDLSDFCIKPTPEMDVESVRKLQEEQDAELARLLQEQETKRSGYSDRDRLIAIEAQDRELAKVLQDQERARAKKAREKARQKSCTRKQAEQDATENRSESPHTYNTLEHCPDLICVAEENSSNSPTLNAPTSSLKKSGITRPTHLDISSTIYSGISENDNARSSATHNQLMSADCDVISSDPCEKESVQNHSVNIAMAIDPTYNRKQHSSSVSNDNGSTGSTPILPSPISIRTGTYHGEDHYYDSDEGPAPPYMPIQGQRRNSSLEKKKKNKNGKEGCKQQ